MRLPVVVALLAAVLSGCSGSDDAGDPDSARTLSAGGYTFRVPSGWRDATGSVPGTDSVAIDGDDRDGFADGVNVIVTDPAPETDPDAIEDATVARLQDGSADDVRVLERRDIDGSVAVHFDGSLTVRGDAYDIEQFAVVRGDVLYVVTFSFSPDLPRDARDDSIDVVLDSWSWTTSRT